MPTPLKVTGYEASMSSPPARARAGGTERSGGATVRITLHGDGFTQRAMPLIVVIGDQAVVSNLEISPDERHIVVHLDTLPEDGAVIRVGHGGDELVELPERFSRSKVERNPAPEV